MLGYQALQRQLPTWTDWFALALMSLAAPWMAAYVHSALVFERGTRLYNAEVGGIYCHGNSGSGLSWKPTFLYILFWIWGRCIPAIPTFVFLLLGRRHVVYRWPIWVCCIWFWTWFAFKMEVALK